MDSATVAPDGGKLASLLEDSDEPDEMKVLGNSVARSLLSLDSEEEDSEGNGVADSSAALLLSGSVEGEEEEDSSIMQRFSAQNPLPTEASKGCEGLISSDAYVTFFAPGTAVGLRANSITMKPG